MDVKALKMKEFMSFKEAELTPPESGIVLVTGANGSGKSTLVEAVAFGLWGKTLRGSKPSGSVEVRAGQEHVKRQRKGGRQKVAWKHDGKKRDCDSASKTQTELEGYIPSFEVWRRTHVFSSADAAHFTLATDSERKRLLENILGLDRFDTALKACREDTKKAQAELAEVERRLAQAEASEQAAERRMSDAEARLKECSAEAPPLGAESRLAALREAASLAKGKLESLREESQKASNACGVWSAQQSGLRQQLKLLEDDDCFNCGRPWDDADERQARREQLEQQLAQLAKPAPPPVEECREYEQKLSEIRQEGQSLKAAQEKYEQLGPLREKLQQQAEGALDELDEIGIVLADLRAEVAQAQIKLANLKACDKVLGMRGVRAQILGRALSGIETIANETLQMLPRRGEALQISLSSVTEKKTGGYSDAISIQLHGAGGPDGYQGSSGGERRRVDVAILLALMEVASATQGVDSGTLFFDEVFDSLDRDGIRTVSSKISELAQDRAVFVISHSEELIADMPACAHLEVSDGRIQRV